MGMRQRMRIGVLGPLLSTWQDKWAERPPKVMKWIQRWNNLQICPRWDSNMGGSDLWSNTLWLDHRGALVWGNEEYSRWKALIIIELHCEWSQLISGSLIQLRMLQLSTGTDGELIVILDIITNTVTTNVMY